MRWSALYAKVKQMNTNQHIEPFEHYNSTAYQQTVRLERMAINGMSPEEFYRREAQFALRIAGYDSPEKFGEWGGILDLASGAGNHAFAMSDILERKVPILATDPAKELGTLAETKFRERHTGGIREKIEFVFDPERMKMQNVARESIGERSIKLITVLGSSFAYTNVRETRQTLQNMWDILEPEGSLILQWRQRPIRQDTPEYQKRKRATEQAAADLGMRWEQANVDSQKADCFLSSRGEKYYALGADCDHPDPEFADEYFEVRREADSWRGAQEWIHRKTGAKFTSFRRVFVDEHGERFDLPKTMMNDICWEDEKTGVSKIVNMLQEAGFIDIEFKQPESDDDWLGGHRLLAMVARKPVDYRG